MFGNIGFTELLVIVVIVLVFFGPKRLPEISRSLGTAMREFRRSLNEIHRELDVADRAPGREPPPRAAQVPGAEEPRAARPPDPPASIQPVPPAAAPALDRAQELATGTSEVESSPVAAGRPGQSGHS